MEEGSKEEYRQAQSKLMRSKIESIQAQIAHVRAQTEKIKTELKEKYDLGAESLDLDLDEDEDEEVDERPLQLPKVKRFLRRKR
jgi:hypothetical protein